VLNKSGEITDLWSATTCRMGDRNINSFKNCDFNFASERTTACDTPINSCSRVLVCKSSVVRSLSAAVVPAVLIAEC
jgi:hypothetical protein